MLFVKRNNAVIKNDILILYYIILYYIILYYICIQNISSINQQNSSRNRNQCVYTSDK